jgi:nucleotide-binding universal stress UspA family protein
MAEVVLAALSGSVACAPVLGFARLFARMRGAAPRALHVAEPHGTNAVRELALAEHVGLRVVDGDPVREIARAAEDPSVTLVVAGAHRAPNGRGPGIVTRQLAVRLRQPLLVVPPATFVPTSLETVLIPLEGNAATSTPIRALLDEFAFDPETSMVAMHSHGVEAEPRFAVHEPYDTEDQVRAFAQHLPARFEGGVVFRAGPREQTVPDEAAAMEAALTVVTWSQVFGPGRAPLVNKLLSDLTHPILLVPTRFGTQGRTLDLRTDRADSAASYPTPISGR